jgi:uncharacterized protein (DUF1697 family)
MAKSSGTDELGWYAALFRAVNVAGKNKLPMKDTVAMFEAAGCRDVRSYIASGNLVFRARPALAAKLPKLIPPVIAQRFGFAPALVVRTADELRRIGEGNPFLRAGADPGRVYVAFLADAPTRASIAALDPKRSPPDEFAVVGREIYLHLPTGAGRTKLTNDYFDSKLKTMSTARNWRTLLKLVELTGG